MTDSFLANYSAASILESILSGEILNDLVARPSLAELESGPVLLAVSRGRSLMLLVPVNNPQLDGKAIKLSDRLSLSDRPQIDQQGEEKNFLAFTATPDFDLVLFGALCDQAIKSLSASENYVELFTEIVETWRDLLQNLSTSNFSQNKAIGLFGELLFLQAVHRIIGEPALDSWVGPEGARYDFFFSGDVMEVKTTTRTDKIQIQVHGIDQFEEIPGKISWLGLAQIEWDPAGISVQQMIDETRLLFANRNLLEFKLEKLGVSEDSRASLEKFRFNLKAIFFDQINGDFPFIRKVDLPLGLPLERISDIRYSVTLDGLCSEKSETQLGVELEAICRKK